MRKGGAGSTLVSIGHITRGGGRMAWVHLNRGYGFKEGKGERRGRDVIQLKCLHDYLEC